MLGGGGNSCNQYSIELKQAELVAGSLSIEGELRLGMDILVSGRGSNATQICYTNYRGYETSFRKASQT